MDKELVRKDRVLAILYEVRDSDFPPDTDLIECVIIEVEEMR